MTIGEAQKQQDEEFEKLLKDYEIIISDKFVNSEPKEVIKTYLHHREQVIIKAFWGSIKGEKFTAGEIASVDDEWERGYNKNHDSYNKRADLILNQLTKQNYEKQKS